MGRLTYRYGPDGLAVPTEFDIGPIANIHDDDIWVGFDTLVRRLAAYEDKIPFDRLDEAAALVKAKKDGLVVVLPCKPNATYLHRNYNTGGLELNIELHGFGGDERDLDFEEIDACAYWE